MWVASNTLTMFTQCHGLRSPSCCIPKKAPVTRANLAMQEFSNQIALSSKAATSFHRAHLRQQPPVNDREEKTAAPTLCPSEWMARADDQSRTEPPSLNR